MQRPQATNLSIVLFLVLLLAPALLRADEARVFPRRYTDRGVKFSDAGRSDQLFPVSINNWWGHMNQRGNLIVFPQFAWADYSFDNRTRVMVDGKTGFITNNARQWFIEPRLPYADRYADGVAIIGDGERYGFIDKAANLITPIRFDGALRFQDGYAAVQGGDRCGFINRNGELVIPLQFTRVRSFHQGLAMVQLPPQQSGEAGVLGYIDKTGQWRYRDDKRRFQDLGDFNQNLARAKQNGKWGYISKRFEWHIEPRFDAARDFTNGVAAVKVGEQWGYIDRAGQMIMTPRFDDADDLDGILAMVRVDDRYGYVNRRGRFVIPPQFRRAEPVFRNYARVAHPPSFGYIGTSGRVVWDPRAPLVSITNLRRKEDLRILVSPEHLPAHRRTALPEPREPIPTPYAPEHIYEEELPDPIQLRWRD